MIHIKYRSLVELLSIENVKTSVDKKASFEKLNPCSLYW